MNRKEKPILRRIFGTLSSFVLIGASGYAFFAGMNFLVGLILAISILSIATPVVIDGGGFFEIVSGIFEAFIEGVMGVFDAVASIFSF